MSMKPPAGWYRDPEQPDQQRYWDGQSGTDDRTPEVAPMSDVISGGRVAPAKRSLGTGSKVLIGVGGALGTLILVGAIGAAMGEGGDSTPASDSATQTAEPTETAKVTRTAEPTESKVRGATAAFPEGVPAWSKALPIEFVQTLSYYYKRGDCSGMQANLDALGAIFEGHAGTNMGEAAFEGAAAAGDLLSESGCYD